MRPGIVSWVMQWLWWSHTDDEELRKVLSQLANANKKYEKNLTSNAAVTPERNKAIQVSRGIIDRSGAVSMKGAMKHSNNTAIGA